MKRLPRVLLLACLACLCVGTMPSELPNGEIPPDLKPVVDGNTRFALELYAKLKESRENLFISPYSVSSALGIAYAGARGMTEQQMADVLHFPLDQNECHAAMAKIRKALVRSEKTRGIELNVANGLWPQKGHAFSRDFLRIAQKKYDAGIEYVDYRTSAGRARDRINDWIEQNTAHRIKNALSSGDVSPDTWLIIANAIYFKGEWASRFDKAQTKPAPFWISAAESVETPMMQQESVLLFAEGETLQVLELPYKEHELSMIVLLPKERAGLAALEAQLTPQNLSAWLRGLERRTVNVQLPKLKIESNLPLRGSLMAMGMPDAFGMGLADFTGMAPEGAFFIFGVKHAAVVEVDEEGTVAAAATTVHGGCGRVDHPPAPATFHADHPFIFLIRDNRTGTILFLGRVLDPTQ